MFGEKRKLMTIQCCVCKKMVALRVDPEDLRRAAICRTCRLAECLDPEHERGDVLVQHAFVDRKGVPYLTAAERELFITGCCDECWHLLCPDPVDRLAYN